jgi:eukaryotic-like serine/threonine-protein kinase
MRHALFLLLVLALSSASSVWQYSTEGAISTKPAIFQGAVAVASDDGNVYGLDPSTGVRRWQTVVGKKPVDLTVADNAVYVSTTQGKVVKLGANGQKQWEANLNVTPYNVTRIYGIAINSKEIFVAANTGVYLLEKNGSIKSTLMNFTDSVLSPPSAGADYAVFGKGNELIRLSDTGVAAWKTKLLEGSFWLSRPVIDGNLVYVGALDRRMHAYYVTNGVELWETQTRNWVVSTPLVMGGSVYFGSNDGNVYAADGGDGNIRWSAQAQLAVQSQPEPGVMGGRQVIFAGGTDKSIYAISTDDGRILWKGTSTAAAGSPLFYQNKVIFGSDDGKIYAYSTERACSITNPREGDVSGPKELVVSGNFVSESGGASVLVQVNSGEWKPANATEEDWVYYINPKTALAPGLNVISCMVADSGGSETGPTFTGVTINYDPGIANSDLVVTVTPDIIEGKNFTVYVNDDDDGSPVDRFNISIDAGAALKADKNYTARIASPGEHTITVKKIGFNDAVVKITVNSSGVNPLYIAIGVLLIIIVVWQLWTKVLKQKFAAKKKK